MMRFFKIVSALALLVGLGACVSMNPIELSDANAAAKSYGPAHAVGDRLKVRTTAYTRDEADHFTFGSMSAMGTPLKLGAVRSAAADWSKFPAGTRFSIDGDPAIYQIDDYGSALVGSDTIDIYQRDEFHMEMWGVRHVDIEILKWGSADESLRILKPRAGTEHVDVMIKALEKTLNLEGKQ